MAFEFVAHLGVVGKAKTCGVGCLYQNTGVEAQGGIVTFNFYVGVAISRVQNGQVGFQRTADAVEGRAKTYGNLVIECVADSRLQSDNLDFTFLAEGATLEAAFIVGDQAERCIYTKTYSPLVIELVGVEAHRNASERHHVTFVGARVFAACILDVGRSINNSDTACYLLAAEAGHTGRVTENGTCIVGRR